MVRVLKVNLDHPALQALQDPPPQLWKTSSFPLTTMTWMAVACRMPWNSSRTKWLLILLHFQRWTKTKLFPIRTRLPCAQTLESTPHWRPSADICKTSAVLTAARWTLQKPARTSSSATLRNRAVRLLFSPIIKTLFSVLFRWEPLTYVVVFCLYLLMQASTGLIQTRGAQRTPSRSSAIWKMGKLASLPIRTTSPAKPGGRNPLPLPTNLCGLE